MEHNNTRQPGKLLWSTTSWFTKLWFISLWFIRQRFTKLRVIGLGFAGLGLMGLGGFGVGLVGSAHAAASAETTASSSATQDTAEVRFQQLDAEVEHILDEVVSLGAEMAALSEARELPEKSQLMVLVSIEPSAFFQLDAFQLQIDGKPVSFHEYTDSERDALSSGGSHRLFWDAIPDGRHQLTAVLMGSVPKDPDFQREAALVTITGLGRRVVELRVTSGKNQAFPELSIKEWK